MRDAAATPGQAVIGQLEFARNTEASRYLGQVIAKQVLRRGVDFGIGEDVIGRTAVLRIEVRPAGVGLRSVGQRAMDPQAVIRVPDADVGRVASQKIGDEEDVVSTYCRRGRDAVVIKAQGLKVAVLVLPRQERGGRTGVAARTDAEEGDIDAGDFRDPVEADEELLRDLSIVKVLAPKAISCVSSSCATAGERPKATNMAKPGKRLAARRTDMARPSLMGPHSIP
jgi:hypothetical protein